MKKSLRYYMFAALLFVVGAAIAVFPSAAAAEAASYTTVYDASIGDCEKYGETIGAVEASFSAPDGYSLTPTLYRSQANPDKSLLTEAIDARITESLQANAAVTVETVTVMIRFTHGNGSEEKTDYSFVYNAEEHSFVLYNTADVYLDDPASWAKPLTLTVTKPYPVYATIYVFLPDLYQNLCYELAPYTVMPITDGSLIKLQSNYNNFESTGSMEYAVLPAGKIFSNESTDNCFVVNSQLESWTGLPSLSEENTQISFSFIYDGKAEIPSDSYVLYFPVIPEKPVTVQGKLTFKTAEGDNVTLYTETVTVKAPAVELLVDGKTLKQAAVVKGESRVYSVSIDGVTLSENNFPSIECSWLFDVDPQLPINFESECDSYDAAPAYVYPTEGDYYARIILYCEDAHGNSINMTFDYAITVLEKAPSAPPAPIPPKYEIRCDLPSDKPALLGGDSFLLNMSVYCVDDEPAKLEEGYAMTVTASGNNLSILRSDNTSVTILPTAAGQGVIYLFCTVGDVSFSKSILLNVIGSTEANTSIVVDGSFHKTGKPVTARLSIDGHSSFLNYTPVWTLKNADGDVPFTAQSDGSVLIEAPAKGEYTLSATDPVSCSVTIAVADVDLDSLARTLLPFVALAMVILLVVFFLVKRRLIALNDVEKMLNKVSESMIKGAEKVKKDKNGKLNRLPFLFRMYALEYKLARCASDVEKLDRDSMGQYQNILSILKNADNIAKAARKYAKTFSCEKAIGLLRSLDKSYIKKALEAYLELKKAQQSAGSAAVLTKDEVRLFKRREKNKPDYEKLIDSFRLEAPSDPDTDYDGTDDGDTKSDE